MACLSAKKWMLRLSICTCRRQHALAIRYTEFLAVGTCWGCDDGITRVLTPAAALQPFLDQGKLSPNCRYDPRPFSQDIGSVCKELCCSISMRAHTLKAIREGGAVDVMWGTS